MLESPFNKVALLKRDSNTGVFMCNLSNFKCTYFEEHLRTAAPKIRIETICIVIYRNLITFIFQFDGFFRCWLSCPFMVFCTVFVYHLSSFAEFPNIVTFFTSFFVLFPGWTVIRWAFWTCNFIKTRESTQYLIALSIFYPFSKRLGSSIGRFLTSAWK